MSEPSRSSNPPAPIYDVCDLCHRPIRPGEEHGVVIAEDPDEGQPVQMGRVTCRVHPPEVSRTSRASKDEVM